LVAQLARDDDTQIRFLGIAWRDSEEAMQDFIDEFGLDSFPHVNDVDERLFARFGVPFQPAWVFIDSQGNAARVLGSVPEQDLVAILEDLAADRLPS
jgi:thioredoxin-related protein